MSVTMLRWSPTDELALTRVQSRLQAICPTRSLTRPQIVKLLVSAASAGVPIESLLAQEDA